jgi:hypothetical protein
VVSIQHYQKETEPSQEEDLLLEEHSEYDLQCGESLAIAANHRMDEGCSVVERFGVWILSGFRIRAGAPCSSPKTSLFRASKKAHNLSSGQSRSIE